MAGLRPRLQLSKEPMANGFVATLFSIAVIASFILAGAGIWLVVKGGNRKQGLLMIAAAAVTIGNVLIWLLPAP